MRFYRRLHPFHAISFDLDDTLYSNHPIMLATDTKMIKYFKTIFSDYGLESTLYAFAQTPLLTPVEPWPGPFYWWPVARW